jgi:hypothetical protein
MRRAHSFSWSSAEIPRSSPSCVMSSSPWAGRHATGTKPGGMSLRGRSLVLHVWMLPSGVGGSSMLHVWMLPSGVGRSSMLHVWMLPSGGHFLGSHHVFCFWSTNGGRQMLGLSNT